MKICFLTGPNKKKEFEIKKNLILSRNIKEVNNILIQDSMASNPHAQIVKSKNKFYLKDLKSKNGTYINKKINDYFVLTPGVKFQIGETFFLVKPSQTIQKWDQIVNEELKKLSVKNTFKKIEIIHPILVLRFQSGVQKGDKWHIYYGPREVGTSSVDLPILEPKAPDICFVLDPDKNSVLFKTSYPEKILVNQIPISKKKLISGDCITFYKTAIIVEYLEKY